MKDYTNGDVVSLEAAYLHALPYMTNHPNIGLLNGEKHACPNCGSNKVQKRGFNHSRTSTTQRFQCQDCFSWSSAPIKGGQIR